VNLSVAVKVPMHGRAAAAVEETGGVESGSVETRAGT
jgi:hypothetical protein